MSFTGDISDLTGFGEFVVNDVVPPALGTGATSILVPSNEIWIPVSLLVKLNTDNNVATRNVLQSFSNGVVFFSGTLSGYTQPENETDTYIFSKGLERTVDNLGGVNNNIQTPMPDLRLLPLFSWFTQVVGVQATDELSQITYSYIRFYI